jgi:hypothetical protein
MEHPGAGKTLQPVLIKIPFVKQERKVFFHYVSREEIPLRGLTTTFNMAPVIPERPVKAPDIYGCPLSISI